MNHDSFVNKNNGRYIDFDGKYGFQCVDLMRKYIKDVYGLNGYSLPAVGYAKQLYLNFNQNNKWFKRVANTPTGVPQKGDIIVWNYYPWVTGWAGHVAIVDTANVMNLIAFSQNYPTNSPCKLVKFSYKGVLGWIKRK